MSRLKGIQTIRKERVKVSILNSFKNNLTYNLISILLFVFFFLSPNQSSPYYLLIYFIAVLMLYPFFSDLFFYASYYDTWENVEGLLSLNKNEEKYDLTSEKFQINYNKLRINLKKRIRSSGGNLLTYDYEINRIMRDIDTFFDATIKILLRRKIMSIPFSPHDEYFMKEIQEQSHLNDDIFLQKIEPQLSKLDFETWEIKNINFETINMFLKYFGDIIVRKPRSRTVNTIAVGELFRKWNLILKSIEKEIYESSKNDVEKYYDEKREKRGYLLKTIFELLVLLISGVIVSLVTTYVTK